MNDINPMALFRYSVLGPLVSRAELKRGEAQGDTSGAGRTAL